MVIIESIPISRSWLLLFYVSDALVRVAEWLPFTLTGQYVLPNPDTTEHWTDRLVDYCQHRAGLPDEACE